MVRHVKVLRIKKKQIKMVGRRDPSQPMYARNKAPDKRGI